MHCKLRKNFSKAGLQLIYLILKLPFLNEKYRQNKRNFFLLIIIFNSGCYSENHIEKNNVQIDSLKILPNSFYAFRRGRLYIEDIKLKRFRIWYDINRGGIGNIYEIEDFKDPRNVAETTIAKFRIDTNLCKNKADLFMRLSKKYEFGHLSVDQPNKIFFSNRDGLLEQYVYALNDSVRGMYIKNLNFRLLKSGWFENIVD